MSRKIYMIIFNHLRHKEEREERKRQWRARLKVDTKIIQGLLTLGTGDV